MPTMMKFPTAPNGVAAAALIHLESGDVNVYVHAVRIEAPVHNQQSQILPAKKRTIQTTKNETKTDEFYFDSSIKRWKTRKNNKANHNVMVTAQMESQELPETEFYFDITSKKWRARSLASTTNNARLSISREQQTPESIEATIAAITQVRRVFICQ